MISYEFLRARASGYLTTICEVGPVAFRPGDWVWVRRPHAAAAPGTVLQWVDSAQAYQVQLRDEIVHCWAHQVSPRTQE